MPLGKSFSSAPHSTIFRFKKHKVCCLINRKSYKEKNMKKRTVIILSILLILIPALFVFIKGSLVTYSVCKKETKFFAPPVAGSDWIQAKERKLIKTGDISFECTDLSETRSSIESTVKQYGGFIVNEKLYKGYNNKTSNQDLKIRVPAEHFDALIADISKGAQHIDSRTVEIEDVTEQYLDTETRLSVKRQLETRYRELLSQASKVTDILEIEKQLAKIREDIESAEGQLKRLDNQVALSTLDVTCYVRLNESPEFARYFRNSIGNGWNNLVWFAVGLLNIWPFILMVIALIAGVRVQKKRKRN